MLRKILGIGLISLVGCVAVKDEHVKFKCGYSLCRGHRYDAPYVKCPKVLGDSYKVIK